MIDPHYSDSIPDESEDLNLGETPTNPVDETLETESLDEVEPIYFRCHFQDSMQLCGEVEKVANYLQNHQTWFQRCALPMKAEPLGKNGYDLLIGRFGSFGYLVEARVGLELLPPDEEGCYRIETIPIPNYTPPGYEVDFRSTMELIELPFSEFTPVFTPEEQGELPPVITSAQWILDLTVSVKFPRFIRAMSRSLIQSTGDRLLETIVRQVNRRLTYKTQLLFYDDQGINFTRKLRKLKRKCLN